MEYKRVTLAFVVVAVMIAGSLATLGNKKILGAQHQRYTSLVQQADRLFSGKNYLDASKSYKQALIINPRDAKTWAKFEQSEKMVFQRAAGTSTVPATIVPQATAPQNETVMPRIAPQEGMIIEEDEGC